MWKIHLFTLAFGLFMSAGTSVAMANGARVPTLSLQDLRAKYSSPDSRYIEVDGVDLHYTDEGQGETIVLLHASYVNLLSWNGIAEELKDRYRIVRFDFPNAGLSGSESKPPPVGKFDLIERNVEILTGFVTALDLEPFNLVATSSGGSVGFRYASYRPDMVKRLVLINSAGMPRTRQTNPNRERLDRQQWADMPVKPREFWAYGFSQNFIAPNEAPDWLVDQVYDFARRTGLVESQKDYVFTTGDPQKILGNIKAPTLIMWGLDNSTVMHLEADVIQHWMTGAPTTIRKYPGLGHYPYIEDQQVILKDLSGFLSGEFDDELRQTKRVKSGNTQTQR